MESLEDQRKLFGIIAVPLVHVVKQWDLTIRTTKQRVAHLSQIAVSLLIHPAFGDLASYVKGVDEAVEIRTVI